MGMKIFHTVLFVGILVFVGACVCVCDPPFSFSFIYCEDGVAVEYDGLDSKGTPLDAKHWDCKDSEPHANSQSAKSSWHFSFGPDVRTGPTPHSTPAASAPPPAGWPFLAQRILQLPFSILSSKRVQLPCNSSFPDVIHVNHFNAEVVRISTCPVQITATIPVASRPLQVAITPDGNTALVTSFDNAVSFIDLNTNKVTYTLQTDFNVNPSGLAITPDGTRAYITSFNQSNPVVQMIDLASKTVTATISVTTYPNSAFLTPDGSQLYVTFPFGNAVYVIDTLTNTIATTLSVPAPFGMAFNSTGTAAYIASQAGNGGGTVQVLDTTTFQLVQSYPVGISPNEVVIPYGDRYVIVTNQGDNTISIIDTSNSAIQTLTTPSTNLEGITVLQ